MDNPKNTKIWRSIIKTDGGSVVLGDVADSKKLVFAEEAKNKTIYRQKKFFLLVRIVQFIAYPLGGLFRWWLRIKVEDKNKTLKKEPKNVIFAASHFGEIDILLIPSILGIFSRHFPVRFFTFESKFYKTEIAKNNLLKKIFYGGWFFEICGACAYDRKNKNLPYRVKLADHIHLLKKLGHSLIIFPSGTIEPLGTVSRVLPGAAALAYYSRRPIVTIRATLSQPLTFRSFLLRKTKLTLRIGHPLYPEDLFDKSLLDSAAPSLESNPDQLEKANNRILHNLAE